MKFKLSTANYYYDEADEVARLEGLGFKFEKVRDDWRKKERFVIARSNAEIEISSIAELLEFIDKYGTVIVDADSITIYDGYIE